MRFIMSVNEVKLSNSLSLINNSDCPDTTINQALNPDAFKFLLGCLDMIEDINAAKSVSKDWYKVVLLTIKDLQAARLQNLNLILCPKLNEAPIIVNMALKKISLCESFTGFQSLILKTREKIVNILKPLSETELEALELSGKGIEQQRFFGKVFKLTKICKSLDSAKAITDVVKKDIILKECASDLMYMGIFEKSIDVAKEIAAPFSKNMAFCDICLVLNHSGKLERAIEIELNEMLPEGCMTGTAIKYTSEALARAGKTEQARDLVNNIRHESEKEAAQNFITIIEMCKQKMFIEVVELANTYEKWEKSCALQEISLELCRIGRLDESIQMADTIPSRSTRESSLESLLKIMEMKEYKEGVEQINQLLNKNKIVFDFDFQDF